MKISYKKIKFIFIFPVLIMLLGFVFAADKLAAPTIVINPDVYYPMDEILYLEGRAQPNVNVQIQFQKQGAKPLKLMTKSDSNGEWVLAEKVPLEAGDWQVEARAVDSNNADRVSEWSNPRVFKVIVSGITIGGVNIKFAFLTLIIVILLVLGIAFMLYFTRRIARLKKSLLDKEIREARESVQKGFSELRQNTLNELKLLESKNKLLSAEELLRKENLFRELEHLERQMEREIKDIEEKL